MFSIIIIVNNCLCNIVIIIIAIAIELVIVMIVNSYYLKSR